MSELSHQLDELYELEEAATRAEDAVRSRAHEIFPVGKIVWFNKFGGEIEAEIIRHGSLRRTFVVQNVVTGKRYGIGLYDLICRGRDEPVPVKLPTTAKGWSQSWRRKSWHN